MRGRLKEAGRCGTFTQMSNPLAADRQFAYLDGELFILPRNDQDTRCGNVDAVETIAELAARAGLSRQVLEPEEKIDLAKKLGDALYIHSAWTMPDMDQIPPPNIRPQIVTRERVTVHNGGVGYHPVPLKEPPPDGRRPNRVASNDLAGFRRAMANLQAAWDVLPESGPPESESTRDFVRKEIAGRLSRYGQEEAALVVAPVLEHVLGMNYIPPTTPLPAGKSAESVRYRFTTDAPGADSAPALRQPLPPLALLDPPRTSVADGALRL